MIPERAEQGLRMLSDDIRNVLNRHESHDVTTTKKDGTIINNIYNYGSKPVSRFNFFSTVGTIVIMLLCGIAIGVGIKLVFEPSSILSWFGL